MIGASARARAALSRGGTSDAGLAVADELRDSPHRRGDDRQSGGHRLEHGHRQALGVAGEHEDVRAGEQLGHVGARAQQLDALVDPEPAHLGGHSGPLGAVAGDAETSRAGLECRHRPDEGHEVLRRPQAADAHDRRRPAGRPRRAPRAVERHAVVDDDRAGRAAGAGAQPRLAFAVGDADGRRGQRAHRAVGPQVRRRHAALVRLEGPAVDGEQPHRHTGREGGEPSEDPGLGAVGVEHQRPLAAEQQEQLAEREGVVERVERPPEMAKLHVARACPAAGLSEEAVAPRGDHDVVLACQRLRERGHVGLRPARLRERDQQQNARARHRRLTAGRARRGPRSARRTSTSRRRRTARRARRRSSPHPHGGRGRRSRARRG